MNLNLLLGMAKDHFKLHTMQEVNKAIESSGLSTPDSKTKTRYCDTCDTMARTKARIRRPNENDDHDYDHDYDDDNDQS